MPLTCTGVLTIRYSATGATLDAGGGSDLTGQGLSPCKVHQASLGAPTAAATGGKPKAKQRV